MRIHRLHRWPFPWISRQEQVLPAKLEEAPQITVPLSTADPHHWNIVNDPIFPNCLDAFKVRHEASLASGAATSTGGASSRGESSTPTQEFWEINQAFAKSLMVEFLRLRAITGHDLSEILRTWQANMEATTDKLLRDLDAATQTSTTLPSKNAAVGVALRQFREATQLRVALPLTRLDEA